MQTKKLTVSKSKLIFQAQFLVQKLERRFLKVDAEMKKTFKKQATKMAFLSQKHQELAGVLMRAEARLKRREAL